MFLPSVVFVDLASIRFTLDVVNDKKRVIVLFNLPVFLLLSLSPCPHSAKPHTDDTWEPIWADRHIIPYYQTAGKARTPPDPLDTEEQTNCWNVDWDRWTGAFGLKRLWGVISVPSAAQFPWRVCAGKTPTTTLVPAPCFGWPWGLFSLKEHLYWWNFVFCPRLFCSFLCLVCQSVARTLSPYIVRMIWFVSEEKNVHFLMIGIKIWKKKKYHKMFPISLEKWQTLHVSWILFCLFHFFFFRTHVSKID